MILVVDDQFDARDLLVRLLRPRGYLVQAAADAAEGLALATHQPPRLFILDQRMPDMTGLAMYALILADPRLAEARVLFVSNAFDNDLAKRALDMGAMEWLVKGVHGPNHILAAVARAYTPTA